MRHIISVLVENKFGVLARVSGLFSGRGYNIDSLCVGETEDPAISRMTIVTHGDDQIIEQIEKQLNKLIDVIKVTDLTNKDHVERELVLIKVKAKNRAEIMEIANIFRARIIDVDHALLTLEVTGSESKIKGIVELLKPFGICDLIRTGKIAITRGNR
ncbi:acetolactate synthase small subunit [bacterium]|nr:acetolactate synthase small subunit [bacterium]MBU1615026.1 acetolactate synthase small subunit [bacterium]